MAGKRRVLDISDIQDELDIYDRLVIRQKRKKKPPKLDNGYDGQDVPRVLPIKAVEEKMHGVKSHTKPGEEVPKRLYSPEEDLPVIVESGDIVREKQVEAIPNVVSLCDHLVKSYEDMDLHKMFASPEVNHTFRLYLHAVKYHQQGFFGLPEELRDLFVLVLRDLAAKDNARKTIRANFVRENYATKHDDLKEMDGIIMRKIDVPARIRDLLDD